ncbi:UDP-glucuronic acid decarboxylase 1 [Ananas comosus]|uniref:UDP-glucuronate decarboxylase n=1 Tax=Ananas comosus TaxID=4615 RepID=A0A199V9L3_ANACO|nr:UDP-glucuronic acid decarboxylase 1 [Ananas comosus]
MKQLHKQPSLHHHHGQIPSPSPAPVTKPSKHHYHHHRSFPRSVVSYLLREHRLLFLLAGAVIASSFFLLHPSSLSLSSSPLHPSSLSLLPSSSIRGVVHGGAGGRRIPVGLRKRPMRIVVTGGAGFVGSHLVDRLLDRGDSVIVVDNFFTGRKENVVHHFGNHRFELIRHDVVDPILLEVDQIYHLACPASPVHYKHNPIKTIISFFPRVELISEVYGDPLEHPQKETYWGHVNPIGVRSCYDEGKRTAETLTMDYHRGAGVEVRIARIFNTYGPRMCLDDGRVVSNFVAQALRKQPMTVYGDGKQTRSFQYVSDLVDGLVALMESDHIGPFNLGNPGEFTMLELAQVVKETIDPSATIEFRPNTADDPHMRKPDITKAKQLLNWEPKIPLRQGLPLMMSDFQKRILDEK